MGAVSQPTRVPGGHPSSDFSSRLAWPDYAKGLAILLVVLCHTAEGVFTALGTPRPAFWHEFIDLSYSFMVPVFFVVAGWFSARTSRVREPGAQVNQVLSGILYPYVLWTVLQTAVMIVSRAGNRVVHWSDLPGFLLVGAMQFWFLRALVIAYAVDLLLRYFGWSSTIRLAFSLVLLAAFSLPELALYPSLALPATHYAYFAAGGFCFDRKVALTKRPAIVFAGVVALVMLLFLHFVGARCTSPWRPFTAGAGIVACISVSALLPAGRGLTLIRLIGRHSLAIYCLHVIVAAGFRLALFRGGVQDLTFHILAGFSAAMLIPLLLAHFGSARLAWLFRFPRRTTPST